jgi:hypothetical protein
MYTGGVSLSRIARGYVRAGAARHAPRHRAPAAQGGGTQPQPGVRLAPHQPAVNTYGVYTGQDLGRSLRYIFKYIFNYTAQR